MASLAAMTPLDELPRLAAARGIDFLVCGGHAVNAYAETNGIDLRGAAFRALCERFADARVYERILQYAGHPSPRDG